MTTAGHADEARTPAARGPDRNRWLTPGVAGIGVASLLSDLGHEIATSVLPSFLSTVLGAPAAALGLIEGIADALSGAAKFAGGALADDPARRRSVAVGGYVTTAELTALIGLANAAWQVGVLRAGAWTARGLRVPARNALLADAVDPAVYGRAYGFERAMDNAGAVGGPVLALALVAMIGIRDAILLSFIPGVFAAVAVVYAVAHLRKPQPRSRERLRFVVRPLLRGRLGRLLAGVSIFEAGNMAATLLILRATELLAPVQGADGAAVTAIALYVGYNVAATLASFPAGRLADMIGARRVLLGGIAVFGLAYATFAVAGPDVAVLGAAFVVAGLAIGAVETAQHSSVASLAPEDLRGSAFGLLAAIQSAGDFIASVVTGLLWTLVSPVAAFAFATAAMGGAALVVVAGGSGGEEHRDPAPA